MTLLPRPGHTVYTHEGGRTGADQDVAASYHGRTMPELIDANFGGGTWALLHAAIARSSVAPDLECWDSIVEALYTLRALDTLKGRQIRYRSTYEVINMEVLYEVMTRADALAARNAFWGGHPPCAWDDAPLEERRQWVAVASAVADRNRLDTGEILGYLYDKAPMIVATTPQATVFRGALDMVADRLGLEPRS